MGTAFKKGGRIENQVDLFRVEEFMKTIEACH
jgi:predicted TIM-barrel enzyme